MSPAMSSRKRGDQEEKDDPEESWTWLVAQLNDVRVSLITDPTAGELESFAANSRAGSSKPTTPSNSSTSTRTFGPTQRDAASGGLGQSSPENRSHAACFDTPSAWPMRVQLMPRSRRIVTWSCTAVSTCETTA
jgi:hypothetical protein